MGIDLHQTESVGEGSDHLQLIKFWPSCAPGKGVCGGAKIVGSALLQPARSVCVSLSAFFIHSDSLCVCVCRAGPQTYNVSRGMAAESLYKAYLASTLHAAFGSSAERRGATSGRDARDQPGPAHYQPPISAPCTTAAPRGRIIRATSNFASHSARIRKPELLVRTVQAIVAVQYSTVQYTDCVRVSCLSCAQPVCCCLFHGVYKHDSHSTTTTSHHTHTHTHRCPSGCVVECRICNRAVADSNLGRSYFAPRSTQPSILPGSVIQY